MKEPRDDQHEVMIARTHYSSDQIIAERGEQIYEERFQADYEQHYSGQYVVIDILTKSAYVAAFPEEALNKANAMVPNGLFHLVRIHTPPLSSDGSSLIP